MNDSEENYEFIKTRIARLWPEWLKAQKELQAKSDIYGRSAKNVDIFYFKRVYLIFCSYFSTWVF